ncbi:hypothetical protein CUU66_13080 [Peribacillus deserti]|uniref:Uncharacterized protein n=1 Tax=Peribacillus deserti TaxID=673318 RepID=A0A2N5M4Y0_9BACI|nr:hypothetical protein CUU66_13080 [Peribacillus deserti]
MFNKLRKQPNIKDGLLKNTEGVRFSFGLFIVFDLQFPAALWDVALPSCKKTSKKSQEIHDNTVIYHCVYSVKLLFFD